jgi:dipeptidyl aminopeptidase/acylaminoacyl peptidase
MLRKHSLQFLFVALLLPTFALAANGPQTVAFPSGKVTLHGVLFKPEGKGPFPAILYNHGSAPGMQSNQAFEAIAPVFAGHGWILFVPYRRGQGLSESAGPYIGDQINFARKEGLKHALPVATIVFLALGMLLLAITRKKRVWVRILCIMFLAALMTFGVYWNSVRAAGAELVRVLETDQLNDQLGAYDWLRQQDFVQSGRIAVVGNSFGGIETVLGAERVKYCAAIDAAGGAESWSLVPELQARMTQAVRNSQAPIFFFQAENDYNLAPSRILSAAMKNAGKPAELKIYPAFGESAADGHSFVRLRPSIWAEDVFRFLDKYCNLRP